jgi:pimeloyl-ACP methyl ester carboxylesterase
MLSLAATLTTSALVLAGNRPPSVLARGGDPARGLLVNHSLGARPFDRPDPARPTVVIIHGFNPAPRVVHFEMGERFAEALERRGELGFNVLAWDWNAATCESLSPRKNSEAAVCQGNFLADALTTWGVDPGRTHLIGHSAGGMVATSAAWVFARRQGRPVAQLTLLEPASYYHAIVFERLMAGTLASRVENYWSPGPSAYGREVNLPGVQSIRVEGSSPYFGLICPLRSDHLAIVGWYLHTVENRACPMGFNVSLLADSTR